MKTKSQIIECLIKTPTDIKKEDLDEIKNLLDRKEITQKDLRPMMLRIFDLNDEKVINNSEADKGWMGAANKWSRKRKEKKFWRNIKNGDYTKIILAEGDSWFEYPLFIADITDHLIKSKNKYAVYSQAYGGDWIANILFEREYIEELSLLKPDVFLISGGGNDIVGDYRLAQLVHKRDGIKIPNENYLDDMQAKLAFADLCFNKEFFALLHLFKLQYEILFRSLEEGKDKFKTLRIITQGYDYAIPSSKKGFGLIRPIANHFINNGKWLNTPLLLRGYRNEKEQIAIVTGMIHHFNMMLIEVGKGHKNVYHVDSRNSVDPKKGWYNELHPKSKEFKDIAAVFEECIESNDPKQKVFKVGTYL